MAPPVPAADAAALADDLARARVVPADRLDAHLADFPGGTAADLADFLVARRALTRFQADRALDGAAHTLALGPYRLVGRHPPGALGPAFEAEKVGRGAPEPVVLVPVPLRSLWRAKQTRGLARRTAALRKHPAVVPLVDADSANGFHYLVWPAAFGERLSDRVAAAGPLPPGRVATVLSQLAGGLAACHAAGLPHGLLSPAAVALPAGGAPARVLDLGAGLVVAADLTGGENLLDTATGGGGLARFLPFAAPEWLAAPGPPTAAADQFSLGAVGYFALTGRAPEPGAAVGPGVGRDLADVLDRMMAADPAARFTGLDEAHLALTAAADDAAAAVLAAPPSGVVGLPTRGAPGGSVAPWSPPVRPADRDDTEDSVGFDLPDTAEGPALNGPPDTPVSPRLPPRASPPPPPAPPPPAIPVATPRWPEAPKSLPPRLPAVPLVGAPAGSDRVPPPAPRTPAAGPAPAPVVEDPALSGTWKRLKRKVMFWKPSTDTVWVRVYGPPAAARSESPRVTVFLFPPHAADSVATLARAFDHDAVLLGAAVLARAIGRGEELAVHVTVADVAVTTPVWTTEWHGSPWRAEFDLLVPWEAPAGRAAGVVSVGQAGVLVGEVEFPFVVTADRG
ncbi:MAG: hypothetical protein U0804_12835 [Gemmataceae bacterium]